jgi:phage portal protein BeeE
LSVEKPKPSLTNDLGQFGDVIDTYLAALSGKLAGQETGKLQGLLHIPTVVADKTAQDTAAERVTSMYTAAQTGGIGYLQKGEEFQELSNTYYTASSDELEFLKSQLYANFGLNEKIFTADASEEQIRQYMQGVVKIYVRNIREEINRKYFSRAQRETGERLMVYINIFDNLSMTSLSEFAWRQKYSGIMNANELRENLLDLPPYPGGEAYTDNRNSVPVSNLANIPSM